MSKGCPFPECVLSDWHDGEHEFDTSEPYGALRMVQEFRGMVQRCDICPELPAKKLFVDENDKGWALCTFCEEEYSEREVEVA